MQWLSPTLLAIQVISALAIIVLVLLQQGKGSEMGAAFGSGSAGSLFGASGAANFLSRTTKWAAIVFFIATGGLAYLAHHPSNSILNGGVMQGFKSAPAQAPKSAPAPAPAASAVPSVPQAAAPAGNSGKAAAPSSAAPAGAAKSAAPDSVPSVNAPASPAKAPDHAKEQ